MAVYHPQANDPSVLTRILELISILIILAAVPAWLGGTIAIFVAAYALALGVWGLLSSWPRRHAVFSAILSMIMIAFLIVNIVLVSSGIGRCVPRFEDDNDNEVRDSFRNIITNDINNNNNNNNYVYARNHWCGSRKAVYITHAILLALFLAYLLLNLIASREERDWERGTHAPKANDFNNYNNKQQPATATTTAAAMH